MRRQSAHPPVALVAHTAECRRSARILAQFTDSQPAAPLHATVCVNSCGERISGSCTAAQLPCCDAPR